MNEKKMMRSTTDKMIAGVCGGLAKYMNLDPMLVRIGMVVLGLLSGIGIPIYIVLWIIMPEEPAGMAGDSSAGGGAGVS